MSSTIAATSSPHPSEATTRGTDDRKAKSAVRAGVLAYFVDMYDIYLPVLALLPATAYFQSTDVGSSTASLLSALVFVSALIARPLGSAVFGHFADTRGRKKSTLVAVGGFGITTLLIAMLPGYETIGIFSIGLLIALRFVDGFFLGGEYTTAVPLAMEWSPKSKRGLYGGIITSMSPAAYGAIALIALLLLKVMPSAGVDSAYVQWGWRIPFVIGAVLAAILFRFYARAVEEPPTDRAVEAVRSPLVMLFSSEHRNDLIQVFVLMTGTWFATNMSSAVLPGLLSAQVGLDSMQITIAMAVMMAVCTVAYIAFGALSQRIGRRAFFISYGISVTVVGSLAHLAVMKLTGNYALTVALVTVLGVFTICAPAAVASYITERFPANVRASGYGVAYSLALIIPAFYAFYLDTLDDIMPRYLAPIVMIALGGCLVVLAAAWGPETKDVDMGFAPTDVDAPVAGVKVAQ